MRGSSFDAWDSELSSFSWKNKLNVLRGLFRKGKSTLLLPHDYERNGLSIINWHFVWKRQIVCVGGAYAKNANQLRSEVFYMSTYCPTQYFSATLKPCVSSGCRDFTAVAADPPAPSLTKMFFTATSFTAATFWLHTLQALDSLPAESGESARGCGGKRWRREVVTSLLQQSQQYLKVLS